jgi:hypothetical protein
MKLSLLKLKCNEAEELKWINGLKRITKKEIASLTSLKLILDIFMLSENFQEFAPNSPDFLETYKRSLFGI